MTDDNIAIHRDSEIKLDIVPVTFEVMAGLRGGQSAGGRATLTVNQSGMYLQWEKEGTPLNPRNPFGVLWGDLRELKRGKKRFSANIGIRKTAEFASGDIILRFILMEESRAKIGQLRSVFEKLPAQAFSRRCPKCSGPVVKDICGNCGNSFSSHQRRKGIRYLVLGALLTMAGIGLFPVLSESALWLIFVGLIVFGVVFLISGIIRLIFGIRAG